MSRNSGVVMGIVFGVVFVKAWFKGEYKGVAEACLGRKVSKKGRKDWGKAN